MLRVNLKGEGEIREGLCLVHAFFQLVAEAARLLGYHTHTSTHNHNAHARIKPYLKGDLRDFTPPNNQSLSTPPNNLQITY